MKKILVTGGAGFLGSNLCKKLVEDKNNFIYCLDNLYTGKKENIEELLKEDNFEFIEDDIRTFTSFSTTGYTLFFDKIDEIYNAACPASPPAYQKNPIFTIETSFIGIKNMLELARKNNAKLLQFSTSEIYGNPLVHPQKEDYFGNVNPIGIRSCYDEGKRIAETLCFDYYRKYKTKIKIIRIFNTYGPNMDKNDGRVVSNFINQALNNEDITIYGDGSQTRSFCYVDDLIDGIIKMMNTSDSIIGPINLGNPREFTIKELAYLVLDKIDTNSKLIYKDLPQDDPIKRKPDISKANFELVWRPKITLEEGLQKTIEYFKKESE